MNATQTHTDTQTLTQKCQIAGQQMRVHKKHQ